MNQYVTGAVIRKLREKNNITQRQLAERLRVSDKTISKWETGLSVPDADMLIRISEVLETPVSTLLGQTITEEKADDLKIISEKLEVINLQLAQRKEMGRRILHWLFIVLCVMITVTFAALVIWKSPYLRWNYTDPETAVFGAAFHVFEYLFVRTAPVILIVGITGIVLTRRKE